MHQKGLSYMGKIILKSRHRLMCGDSTDAGSVALLMDGQKAPLCFTSPPYSDQREYNGGDLSTKHLATFISAIAGKAEYLAVNLGYSRKDGEVNEYWNDYTDEAKKNGLCLLSWNVWDRSGLGGSIGNQTAFFPIWHEWIMIYGLNAKDLNRTKPNKSAGSKSGTNRQADGTLKQGSGVTAEFGKIGTVTRCGTADGKLHPAMFPVELPETYIEAMTDRGDLIYEPFSGSGTTIMAAEKTNRRCYAMELSPNYVDVAILRFQDFTGTSATLEGTTKTFSTIKQERLGNAEI
jgi:DNA modification methylase